MSQQSSEKNEITINWNKLIEIAINMNNLNRLIEIWRKWNLLMEMAIILKKILEIAAPISVWDVEN